MNDPFNLFELPFSERVWEDEESEWFPDEEIPELCPECKSELDEGVCPECGYESETCEHLVGEQ